MELALYLTDVLRDILVAYLLMHFAGARRLRGLVVPVLIIERVERFFELSHLLMHPLAPAVDKFEALVYSRITLDAPVDKPLYLFYGHTRLFQALYNRKPLNILVFKHSYSAARALDKRQKPLFVIISECRGRDAHLFCHLFFHLLYP